mmetsp:Transcript_31526/g.75523  ORF Transcript_31526/g.75523 Transcript_31526/m.75523 type:complete len:251 (-) Transcript_31526:83-835(-)
MSARSTGGIPEDSEDNSPLERPVPHLVIGSARTRQARRAATVGGESPLASPGGHKRHYGTVKLVRNASTKELCNEYDIRQRFIRMAGTSTGIALALLGLFCLFNGVLVHEKCDQNFSLWFQLMGWVTIIFGFLVVAHFQALTFFMNEDYVTYEKLVEEGRYLEAEELDSYTNIEESLNSYGPIMNGLTCLTYALMMLDIGLCLWGLYLGARANSYCSSAVLVSWVCILLSFVLLCFVNCTHTMREAPDDM